MISDEILAQVIYDWQNAPYGHKTTVIRKWAEVLDVSYNCLYMQISSRMCMSKRKRRNDKGKRFNQNIEEWTRIVWGIKLRPPKEAGQISSDQALELAIKNGAVPAEAEEHPVSTYNRIANDLGLNRTTGRFNRFQAKYANLVHQIDASNSKFFYVARKLPNGDCVLKMHRPAKKPYKNQPTPTGDRLLLYGLVDDFSGQQICRYTNAPGESGPDGLLFLHYAWGEKEDKRVQFSGLPKMVYIDNGPIKKNTAVQKHLENLDIKVIPRTPYNSQAGGKIERPWATLFQRLELPFFVEGWEKLEILMSELNRQLINYQLKYNAGPHRYQKDLSREQMWWNSVNEHGGIITVPPDALATAYKQKKHSVRGGYFTHETVEYEVIGLDEGPIWMCKGLYSDRFVAVHRKTKQKYEVKLFKPLSFGQRIEKVKTEAEKIVEESRENISISNILFSEDKPANNVVNMPVRQKEEREIEDPLKIPEVDVTEGEGDEMIFASDRERYEWLLKRKINGEKLPEDEIKFMWEFEQSPLYRQLAKGYRKWDTFYKKRAAAGGSR